VRLTLRRKTRVQRREPERMLPRQPLGKEGLAMMNEESNFALLCCVEPVWGDVKTSSVFRAEWKALPIEKGNTWAIMHEQAFSTQPCDGWH
jgi:hypothetical protein